MAATHTLTGNIVDLTGATFTASRLRVYVVTNLGARNALVDKTTNLTHLGGKQATVDQATGQFTVDLIDTSATDLNVLANTLEYEVRAEYVNPGNRARETWSSGWFPLTADANLADITTDVDPIAVQSASTYAQEAADSAAAAESALVAFEAKVLEDLGTTDAQTSALIETPASETAQALSATIGRGVPGGTAPLDETGKVPSGNLPPGLGGGGSGSSATALYPLNVPTHDGLPGAGHPDVLHIPGGFGGYEYWMGYTPLPGTSREVVIVLASHDGITWVNPAGPVTPTPIATYAEAQALYTSTGWWSDTDLVLSPDGTTLMLYWRGTQPSVTNDLWLATSTDGLTWSKSKVMTGGADASPAVVVEDDGTFTLFACGDFIRRRTSPDGVTWSAATNGTAPALSAPFGTPWHIDVVKVDGVYHALVNCLTSDPNADPHRTMHWTSTDGLTWTGATTPAVPLSGSRYDARGNYRSTLQPAASGKAGKFDLWMSMIDDTRDSNHTAAVWRIGLVRDFDFTTDNAATAGEGWAYPTIAPGWEMDPYEGDSHYVYATEMHPVPGLGVAARSSVGSSTAAADQFISTLVMAPDDYILLTTRLPRGWHRMAVDVQYVSHVTLTDTLVPGAGGNLPQNSNPEVAFQGQVVYYREGAAPQNVLGSTVASKVPVTAQQLGWQLNVFNGATASNIDVRRDGLVSLRLRRRGATTTYRDTTSAANLPLHVVAVRFRRV